MVTGIHYVMIMNIKTLAHYKRLVQWESVCKEKSVDTSYYDQFNYSATSHSSPCYSSFDLLLHQSQEQQARRASHGDWQRQRDDGTGKQRLPTKSELTTVPGQETVRE